MNASSRERAFTNKAGAIAPGDRERVFVCIDDKARWPATVQSGNIANAQRLIGVLKRFGFGQNDEIRCAPRLASW